MFLSFAGLEYGVVDCGINSRGSLDLKALQCSIALFSNYERLTMGNIRCHGL